MECIFVLSAQLSTFFNKQNFLVIKFLNYVLNKTKQNGRIKLK